MDWTGLSECDQSELGLIVNGETHDPEALNALIQREQQMLELAAQVAKHGPGYGQEPLQSTDGSTVQQNVARAETLVPRGADPPKRKPEEEPTFKLRRSAMLTAPSPCPFSSKLRIASSAAGLAVTQAWKSGCQTHSPIHKITSIVSGLLVG